jgi:hypothetical protein
MGLGAGQIVYEDDLAVLPGQLIARGDRGAAWSARTPATNTDEGIVRVDNVSMKGGRSYRVEGRFRGTCATVTDRVVGRVRWTDTGVAATTASAELERTELDSADTSNTIATIGYAHPTVDVLGSFLLIFMRVGTSQMTLQTDGGSLGRLMIFDIGPTVADTGTDV